MSSFYQKMINLLKFLVQQNQLKYNSNFSNALLDSRFVFIVKLYFRKMYSSKLNDVRTMCTTSDERSQKTKIFEKNAILSYM